MWSRKMPGDNKVVERAMGQCGQGVDTKSGWCTDLSDAICRLSESQASLSMIHIVCRQDLQDLEPLATALDVLATRVIQDLVDVTNYLDSLDTEEWKHLNKQLESTSAPDSAASKATAG